jgi:hypothetical protein
MKVIDVRVIVEDGTDETKFLDSLVNKRQDVLGAVQLVNNGFGHLVPQEGVLILVSKFLGDNAVVNALVSGEVRGPQKR